MTSRTGRKRQGWHLGLIVALVALACEPHTLPADSEVTTAAPSATIPALAPQQGSLLVRQGESIVSARGAELWRVPLPFGSSAPRRHSLGGTVAAMVALDDGLLVTLREPGALVRLAADLREVARLELAHARGLSLSADGKTAIVANGSEVVGVSVANMTRLWDVAVAAPAVRITLAADGRVGVAHAVGISLLDRERRVTRLAAGALDPLVLPSQDGLALAYGTLAAQEVRAEVARLDRATLPPTTALPAPARVAASVGTTLWIATDSEWLVLDHTLTDVMHRSTTVDGMPCRDPRGLLALDGAALLSCDDGALVRLPRDGAEPPQRIPLEAVADPCEGVEVGPIAHEFRTKYGSADEIHGWLRRYHCSYRELTDLVTLGHTHQGRPVLALVIGRTPRLGHDKPVFFINGAHHGSELMSSTFALDAIDQLLEHRHPAVPRWWREEVVFVVVPLVNPDGNAAYLGAGQLGRKNGRDNDHNGARGPTEGVDLNRNYPFRWHSLGEMGSSSKPHSRYYRGPAAASEPETQALMRFAESTRFVASVSFHTGTLALLAPYTIPHVNNPTPNEAWTVAEQIAKQMIGHPEGQVPVRKNLYPVDGTDQDWLRHEHGTLALLVEGARKWQVDEKAREEIVRAVRYAWTKLVDRYLEGAAVGGRVVDAVGRPLQAEVAISEIYLAEKEHWTTRCSDGRFDRMLSRAGDYTLVVKLGDHVVKKKITVGANQRTHVDVVLPVLITEPARCAGPEGGPSVDAQVIGVKDAQ